MAIKYLDNDMKITKYENNLVCLTLSNGEVYNKVESKRLFPQNNPDNYITFVDEEGKEVGVLVDPSGLDPESYSVLQASLRGYYMVPIIEKIYFADMRNGAYIWEVETDHGYKTFQIVQGNVNVRITEDGRGYFRDTYDNKYYIPDVYKLDKKSLKLLFTFL